MSQLDCCRVCDVHPPKRGNINRGRELTPHTGASSHIVLQSLLRFVWNFGTIVVFWSMPSIMRHNILLGFDGCNSLRIPVISTLCVTDLYVSMVTLTNSLPLPLIWHSVHAFFVFQHIWHFENLELGGICTFVNSLCHIRSNAPFDTFFVAPLPEWPYSPYATHLPAVCVLVAIQGHDVFFVTQVFCVSMGLGATTFTEKIIQYCPTGRDIWMLPTAKVISMSTRWSIVRPYRLF